MKKTTLALLISAIILCSCSSPDDSTLTELPTLINSVDVKPDTVTVTQGQSHQFTAIVDGTHTEVTWSIAGNLETATNISTSGRLSVAPNETAESLNVIAVSTTDPSKGDTSIVTVPAIIIGIAISPTEATLSTGQQQQFTATVSGSNSLTKTADFSITGTTNAGTTISPNGLLTIAPNETATSLTITAKATADQSKSVNAIVNITQVTSVIVTPNTASINLGQTREFTATVNGINNPPQTVDWSVTGSTNTGTSINSGLLQIATNETSPTLTITATSTYNTQQSGNADVTVLIPTISSITIAPNPASVSKGQSQQFTATVNGTNNPPTTVNWSVTGGIPTTTITQEGILSIAITETATSLTVTATSTYITSQSGDATVNVLTPTVSNIVVTPNPISLNQGQTQQFTAIVNGTNNPPQTVSWSVTGNASTGTSINNGLLQIASNETSPSLTVTATSTYDASQSGNAIVTVSSITSILVSPANARLAPSESQQFTSVVDGINNPPQNVNWTVTGGVANTTINAAGLLTVASNQTPAMLTVIATSIYDTTKYGTASITVFTITGVTVDPATVSIERGQTQLFTAVVNGGNEPPQEITWSVTGSTNNQTFINTNGLLSIASNETSASLTVTATSTYAPSQSGNANVTVLGIPTITSVVVSPNLIPVPHGQSQQFTAEVTGTSNPPTTVTWAVTGGSSNFTSITPSGLLTVGSNETATTLIVTATSTFDTNQSGTAEVIVSNITSITVSPATTTIRPGGTQQFTRTVNGFNNPSQSVTWTATGPIAGIAIGAGGLLSVPMNLVEGTITVTATSTVEPRISGTAIVTMLGYPGPAGGLVFYDKGEYSNGWRYLEAAPATSEFQAPWGLSGVSVATTGVAIGTGQSNTAILVNLLNNNGETGKAAQVCDALSINGFADWFLPSKDELNQMYSILRVGNNIGGFNITGSSPQGYYWTSSVVYNAGWYNEYVWYQRFSDGWQYNISSNPNYLGRSAQCSVRAIRAF